MVIGTVKGDIHDIGKNLVGMMMEGAGFEVIDLGINTDAETYIAALGKHQPDILGMSALADDDHAVHEGCHRHDERRGVRDDFIVLVGGAPLNEEFGAAIGADAYCRDAATAVEVAKNLIARTARVLTRAMAPGPCSLRAVPWPARLVELQTQSVVDAYEIQCLPAELHNPPQKNTRRCCEATGESTGSTSTYSWPTPTAALAAAGQVLERIRRPTTSRRTLLSSFSAGACVSMHLQR